MSPLPTPPSAPPDLLAGEALPPPPQQARSRAKRDALLQAALGLFGERGYEATSIEAIAHQAGVAVGGFYQHFVSKRQLLLVLMNQLLHEASAVTHPPLSAAEGSTREAIATIVRQGLQVDWAFAGAYRAWREAALQDAALHERNLAIEQWTTGQLAQLLQHLLTLPGARPDVDVATVAWALGLLFWRIAETPLHEPAQVERVVAGLTQLIFHTLFADPPAGVGVPNMV